MIRKGERNEIAMISPKIPVTLAMDGKAILVNIEDIKNSLRRIAFTAVSATFADVCEDKARETADALADTVLGPSEIEGVTSDAFAQLFADVITRAVNGRIQEIEAGNVEKN